MIIIDSWVVTSWFTFANLQSVCQTAKAKKIVVHMVFLYLNDQFWHTYLHIETTWHVYLQAE